MYSNHHQYQPQPYPNQQEPHQQYYQQQDHPHPVNSSGFCCDCQSYTMTSQWYHQGVHHHGHHSTGGGVVGLGGGGVVATPTYNYLMDTPASNSREQRNKAEKQRRDKLNSFITELACLVPMVFNSPKRMDKTSILRLSATHLRIYQTLNGGSSPKLDVPRNIDQSLIESLVCDELNGFLLILTATGKVVFVSQTVETLLGHLQTDLMGQTIFTIAAPEDHDRLKLYITQSADEPSTSAINHRPTQQNNHYNHRISDRDWRKYFNIRLKRAGPRSEPPVYENVNVMGMQRPSANAPPVGENGGQGQQTSSTANSDLWVFFVRINRPEAITSMLLEASKDEYVTRHYVDGRIIDCDQRISLIAGYMIEEINGISAFNFMHKEDVHWTIVALRQMYDRGESRGNSCYRLQSKTGQFIYLRTFAFLEADSTGTVETFICVNSLVSEREGIRLNREMKEKYSALVCPGSNSPLTITELDDNGVEAVEDPQTIEVAIENLLHNLPTEADVTYQELINSEQKKMKIEPGEYINYSDSSTVYSAGIKTGSSNGSAIHAEQGVKRPATGKSPYNDSAKHRKVTKLLMRPASNPSAQAVQPRTPTPGLSASPTVSSTTPRSQQTPTPPIFIKQEEPSSPLSMQSTFVASPIPLDQISAASPLSGHVNMGANSPGSVGTMSPAALGIIMPPTPMTPSMDHSYPYRAHISPDSNHIQQQLTTSISRNLLSPPMSNSSLANSPNQIKTSTICSPRPEDGNNERQQVVGLIGQTVMEPSAIVGLEQLEDFSVLEEMVQYNGGGAKEFVSGRGDVR